MNTIELITAIQEIYLCLFTAQQRHGKTCSANLHIVMLANACSVLGVKNAFKHTDFPLCSLPQHGNGISN